MTTFAIASFILIMLGCLLGALTMAAIPFTIIAIVFGGWYNS